MKFWTQCYGLGVASDIDLLGTEAPRGHPDLVIRLTTLDQPPSPAMTEQWGRDSVRNLNWAVWPQLARVEAHDCGEIDLAVAAGLDVPSLRVLAVSTALPLALQSRPGLVLEASAVRWQDEGLIVLGRGYCGKSTLAALMAELGAELIADSHCHLRLGENGSLSIMPALPHARLWPAQAKMLGSDWPNPEVLRPGLRKQLFVVPKRFASGPVNVRGLIVLRRGIDARFRQYRLGLAECLQSLALSSDRLRTDVSPSQKAQRFQIMGALASLSVCHLLQWPRHGRSELETRVRLLRLLRDNGWEATA